jgi:hypothetical protein
MESFSKPEQPGWQDISFELIEEQITNGNLQDALSLCNVRKNALLDAMEDVESAVVDQSEKSLDDQRDVAIQEWETEQGIMQKEIDKLYVYIIDIKKRLEKEV